MHFTLFLMFIYLKKYFVVLYNIIKTNKNPEKNPDLPMDFENLDEKPKVSRLL
jgi:hypothetical protein